MSTMDPTRVRKPAGERWRPGHRGDRASDSSWWSGACSRTSAELGTSEIRRYSIFGTIMDAGVIVTAPGGRCLVGQWLPATRNVLVSIGLGADERRVGIHEPCCGRRGHATTARACGRVLSHAAQVVEHERVDRSEYIVGSPGSSGGPPGSVSDSSGLVSPARLRVGAWSTGNVAKDRLGEAAIDTDVLPGDITR